MVDEFLMAQEAKLRQAAEARKRLRTLRAPPHEVIGSIVRRNRGNEWSKTVGDWIGWAIGTAICCASTILVLLYDRASVT